MAAVVEARRIDAATLGERIERIDWGRVEDQLDALGHATPGPLLTAEECRTVAEMYDEARFRSRVVMARHGFGRGEYKYFAYPLPPLVARLRRALYPPLAAIANRWNAGARPSTRAFRAPRRLARALPRGRADPADAAAARLRRRRLQLPASGPLRRAGLPAPGRDPAAAPGRGFRGRRIRADRAAAAHAVAAEVVPLGRGDGVVFPVNQRPVEGTRGVYRVAMRHGVSRLRSGRRTTLGIIFHDAA